MLIGDTSVKVWNVHFVGTHEARGVFYSKDTPLEISEGIILSTGSVTSAIGPNKGVGFTTSNRSKGDADLHFLAQYKTYDATYISFEFTPNQDLIRFNYVFASEEYPEYVGSTFNDVFGFFLTDLETGAMTNLAVIPNTDLPITVNNINHKDYSNFYIKNKSGSEAKDALIEYDGLTKPLIAFSEVVPGRKYRIKIAIADVADDAFDSSVFLEGKSFRSEDKESFYKINTEYFQAFSAPEINPLIRSTPTPIEKPKTQETQKPTAKPTSTPVPSETQKPKQQIVQVDPITIYFDFDSYTPTKVALQKLKSQLDKIDLSMLTLTIEGHTDQKGTSNYNQNLSASRAQFISHWISFKYGIKAIKTNGNSFNKLAINLMDASSRAKNRRVVIYFHYKNL